MSHYIRSRKIINWFAGSISIAVAILIPFVFVSLDVTYVNGNLDSEVIIYSRIISGIINNNPEMWKYEQERFKEILSQRPKNGAKEIRRIIDNQNKVIAESADDISSPYLKKSYDLKESGVTVGRIEICRSWRPLLLNGIFAFIVGALIAASIFFCVNILFRELIQAEKALQESETFLNILLNSIPIPVFYKGTDGRYLGFNTSYEAFLGKTKNKLIGKTVFDINPPELAETDDAKDQELLKKGSIQEYESQVQNANGDIRDVIFNKAVFHDQQGNISGLIGTILDITERKRSEIEREKLQAKLLQSQKMQSIGVLAGGIAHDFNNILSIILGNAELALDDVPEWNPARLNLEEVRTACLKAKDVVLQLLSFARKARVVKKPTNIAPIIKESLKMLRASIPTNIDIRQNISEDIGPILADPIQINQVVINLCTNAYHAMPDDGIINITIENKQIDKNYAGQNSEMSPGRYVHLSVSDTGLGISQKDIDQIFEPYFTTKEVGKGSGMGLAVVHGIVKNHNGIITVESELGKGTTFGIFFPVIKKEAIADIVTDEKVPTGHEKILFVDDEELIVKLGCQRLERLGYSVEATTSPTEALALFKSKPNDFDLVITDMTMPEMTGDKLIEDIMKIRSDIPIILCTGFSEKVDEAKAKVIGVADYIEKPLDKRNFAFKVRKVLDQAKSFDQG